MIMRSLTSSLPSKQPKVSSKTGFNLTLIREESPADKSAAVLGKAINFYSHVGVSPSASTSEITKAYRKKSLELQCVQTQ